MIIINSDDFAYSPATNKATVMALEQNLISSTTALMNFKEGLEDAVAYVGSGQVKAAQLGIHPEVL